MNGESLGGSRETAYLEPEPHIKSYQLVRYQMKDKNNKIYDVDTINKKTASLYLLAVFSIQS